MAKHRAFCSTYCTQWGQNIQYTIVIVILIEFPKLQNIPGNKRNEKLVNWYRKVIENGSKSSKINFIDACLRMISIPNFSLMA